MPLRPVVRLLPSRRLIVALRGVVVCMVVELPDWTSPGERVRAVNRGNSDLLCDMILPSQGADVVVGGAMEGVLVWGRVCEFRWTEGVTVRGKVLVGVYVHS